MAETLREYILQYVPDGFRDEDGIWHDGPHRIAALAELERLDRAYRQACTNLATIRPEGYDLSIGEIANLYYDALLAGWGGILGWRGNQQND